MHADALQQQHAWKLACEKTNKEYAGTKTILTWRKAEVLIHLQGRKANVYPVERT
jgi:hypothetical protein